MPLWEVLGSLFQSGALKHEQVFSQPESSGAVTVNATRRSARPARSSRPPARPAHPSAARRSPAISPRRPMSRHVASPRQSRPPPSYRGSWHVTSNRSLPRSPAAAHSPMHSPPPAVASPHAQQYTPPYANPSQAHTMPAASSPPAPAHATMQNTPLPASSFVSQRPPTSPGFTPSAGGIAGGDFYHGNSNQLFNNALPHLGWAALKATQGTGYKDPSFQSRWSQLGQLQAAGKMPLRVAYGFLTPGNGAAQANALMTAAHVNGPLPAGSRLMLDWEAGALKSPQTLTQAAQTIYNRTGSWPMVYASSANIPAAHRAVPNAPLWEARYLKNGAIVHNYPFTQYSDHPYDQDMFNGNMQQLRQFAGYNN